jgi:hypothetical protein
MNQLNEKGSVTKVSRSEMDPGREQRLLLISGYRKSNHRQKAEMKTD